MQRTDRFLLAIVAGIAVLVVVAFVLALRQPEPTYREAGDPEAVVHNYLLALRQDDYERAWGYLSPSLEGYPTTVEDFVDDVTGDGYFYGLAGDRARTVTVDEATVTGERAVVTVRETTFRQGELFGDSQYSTGFRMRLEREEDDWRLTSGERYWNQCWSDPERCPGRAYPAPARPVAP